MRQPVIIWFRQDLRLADQAAICAAASTGQPVIPVYILDDETSRDRKIGGASRWWLHHSLKSLDHSLRQLGSRLILRKGASEDVLVNLALETGATSIHCLSHYEPWWRNAERRVEKGLADACSLIRHDGNFLCPPGTLVAASGSPYKIFTPFWNALSVYLNPSDPSKSPDTLKSPEVWPASDLLGNWSLSPTQPDWAIDFDKQWKPGEDGAREKLEEFLDCVDRYSHDRNYPSIPGSSLLSPHLHYGEISPRTVWQRVVTRTKHGGAFLRELAWRDYAQNVILQFPEYGAKNGRSALDSLHWREGREAESDFLAWARGRTGYPIVDAGMRQLWATGWMHNRGRMIAASFLIKHLLIDWRSGERWFWDTLVDADYGCNTVNWQWVAGTGIDSNMFVRIMAPLVQSPKFEAAEYIRQWVPELSHLSDDTIHDPDEFGCRPRNYPEKIIGHKLARERALEAYREV